MKNKNAFDVIIIGGSYAGLSAAMALGRSLRKVLIIDSGLPCNRQTPHSHNFITLDGEKPANITAKAKEQVLQYNTISFYEGIAVKGEKKDSYFSVLTHNSDVFYAKKLIFATGIKDVFPDIKGFSDCWGISVVHCPYCHGYEVRGKKTAILAQGERAFHLASLVNNLTQDITLITSDRHLFTKEQLQKLENHTIRIIDKEIIEVIHVKGYLSQLVFIDGSREDFEAVYAAIPFQQNCTIPVELGCEITEMGHLKVDGFQKTTVSGIYTCGDTSSMMRSVATAVASGNICGAMVNMELINEEF
ncbi:Pyridine nucleotide-disulfide oxidoreductase [Flavobacterium sp. 9AF]|uniref:NAD(P)/FAD-dependent oxidoreductase n=1 Tax=Flavobacterium sp. 9AF TaxID=2653142 RepID=UPI0012F39F2D|nr:NAD(P)/FAD-dependent oxidoreductase [Flavobacterium sp. 9AF]VXA92450.1 Pyridine nucleotide-disulfide oxidoreductase [Flavobacterium sp. 9AF]